MHFPTNQECKTKRRPTLYSENKAMGAIIAKKKRRAPVNSKCFNLSKKNLSHESASYMYRWEEKAERLRGNNRKTSSFSSSDTHKSRSKSHFQDICKRKCELMWALMGSW